MDPIIKAAAAAALLTFTPTQQGDRAEIRIGPTDVGVLIETPDGQIRISGRTQHLPRILHAARIFAGKAAIPPGQVTGLAAAAESLKDKGDLTLQGDFSEGMVVSVGQTRVPLSSTTPEVSLESAESLTPRKRVPVIVRPGLGEPAEG